MSTAIIDPPWEYQQASKHERLTGYSTGHQYDSISTARLGTLPIKDIADYIFLWTTGPFIEEAFQLVRGWGFLPITTTYWVKCASITPGDEPAFKPTYGVGYWFRGCVEPIIVAKKPGKPSIRTPWIGILSESAKHSRKPDTLHELIEADFPGPYTELFARRPRDGWRCIGNEITGNDIAADIENLKNESQGVLHG
jgi:N6-adenosine-specific RNA methylase IME4